MKTHVVFLPSPGLGHTIPLFQLARRLSDRQGLAVTFLIITTRASAGQNRFFQQQASLLPEDFRLLTIPPADVSSLIADDTPPLTELCVIVNESLKPLKSILTGLNPDALIIDTFTTQAIDVCSELSIPVYSFFTAAAVMLAFAFYLPTMRGERERESSDISDSVELPGCRRIHYLDLGAIKDQNAAVDHNWYFFHARRLPAVSGIFVNTWEELDPSYLTALRENEFFTKIPVPPVYPIGPLIKDEEVLTEQDGKIMAWLQNQPPESVLFICFGSGGALTTEELTELAAGLEMSRQRFIMVVRKPRDHDVNASATSFNPDDGNGPSAYLPEGFIEKTKGIGVVVENLAPQVAVLQSASTGGFLTHCGWNSALESLTHGVPMIAWPLYGDQLINAAVLVEDIGVAVRPEVSNREAVVGRKEVERVVRALMEGEEGKAARKRSKELEESARKALDHGGSSFDAISRAMDSIAKVTV